MTLETTRERRQREEREALEMCNLEVGQRVWYWLWQATWEDSKWVEAEVLDGGSKDGYPVFGIKLTDKSLPDYYQGALKWGYGWAVKPWSEEKPERVDIKETYP